MLTAIGSVFTLVNLTHINWRRWWPIQFRCCCLYFFFVFAFISIPHLNTSNYKSHRIGFDLFLVLCTIRCTQVACVRWSPIKRIVYILSLYGNLITNNRPLSNLLCLLSRSSRLLNFCFKCWHNDDVDADACIHQSPPLRAFISYYFVVWFFFSNDLYRRRIKYQLNFFVPSDKHVAHKSPLYNSSKKKTDQPPHERGVYFTLQSLCLTVVSIQSQQSQTLVRSTQQWQHCKKERKKLRETKQETCQSLRCTVTKRSIRNEVSLSVLCFSIFHLNSFNILLFARA